MKKPRSPGQRSFGSDRDWEKVANSSHVKRAINDPAIAGALYQNFRQTGGSVPGMQDGGGVPTPEELNRLSQIRSGDVDPETANQMEQLAVESRPQPARPQRPVRFAEGGANMADLNSQEQQAMGELAKAQAKGDVQGVQAAQAKLQQISAQKNSAVTPSASPISAGGVSASSGTMAGLKQLGQQGPPTAGNMAAAVGGGALLGAQGGPWGAIIGAGTAGLLNYFIRKKHSQQNQDSQSGSGGGGSGGYSGQSEPNLSSNPSGYTPQQSTATATSGAPAPNNAAGPTPPPGPGLWMASANTGFGDPNVTSRDGQTWTDSRGNVVPAANINLASRTQITSPSAPTAPDAAPPPAQGLGYLGGATDPSKIQYKMDPTQVTQITQPGASQAENALGSFGLGPGGEFMGTAPGADMAAGAVEEDALAADGWAKGGPVKKTKIPVLHIMIAPIPRIKGQGAAKPALKRNMGGNIPQAERQPRRPAAVPPVRGPLPHGRVQVPKGSGAAIKGKRFGGIF